jgi:hypothetical protein
LPELLVIMPPGGLNGPRGGDRGEQEADPGLEFGRGGLEGRIARLGDAGAVLDHDVQIDGGLGLADLHPDAPRPGPDGSPG